MGYNLCRKDLKISTNLKTGGHFMKVSKKFVVAILTLIIMSMCSISTYAFFISTYATAAPGGKTGEWASSSVDKSITTPTSNASGSSIGLYAKTDSFKSLSSSFVGNSGRSYEIYAMEDDPAGDDHYKTYKGIFNGRALNTIELVKTNISGSVEPNANVELYTKHRVGKITGDKTSTYTTLFSYYYQAL